MTDVARLGEADEVRALREILIELGDTPEDHERIEGRWDRALERARSEGDADARLRVAEQLERQIGRLTNELEELEGGRRARLIEVVLQLDGENADAHEALGHERVGGRWMNAEERRLHEGALRAEELGRHASLLEVDVESGPSTNPAAKALFGDRANCVRAYRIHLHSDMADEKLRRILVTSVRAIALAHALLDGELGPPLLEKPIHLVLTTNEAQYERALVEAREHDGIDERALQLQRERGLQSFVDDRGWRTSRWRLESGHEALVAWEFTKRWLGWDAQPCFLGGCLNWLCLSRFGTTMPSVLWRESPESGGRTTTERREIEGVLWKSAKTSLYGCRAWLRSRIEAGEGHAFSQSVVAELGMLSGPRLLKATLVAEYLLQAGELRKIIEATRVEEDRVAAIENALGRSLPEFDEEWENWLFNGSQSRGMLQRLRPHGVSEHDEGTSRVERSALDALRRVRAEAFGAADAWHEEIRLFEDLSRAAEAHARYLTLNPEQQSEWPAAHEEYPDREGFTPEGAWAGKNSVISFVSDPVEAVEGWMGTFYHRLPLLEPGLGGIGVGVYEDVTVFDASSIVAPYWGKAWVVWPAPNASGVPRAFQPELPNPVPGEDQSRWGYPVTLQLFRGKETGSRTIEMTLTDEQGRTVECHYLTPTQPAFPEHVPEDAYCLIPKSILDRGATYTVHASCAETGAEQDWTFTTDG